MTRAIELAEAIVAALNDHDSFSLAFKAKRRVVPFMAGDSDLSTLQVAVFVGSKASVDNDRGRKRRVYKPVIHVAKKLPEGDEEARVEAADGLIALVDEIEAVAGADRTGEESYRFGFMRFDEEQDRDAYNAEALRSHGCFSVPIVLEFWG